jgi:hypothetical protein
MEFPDRYYERQEMGFGTYESGFYDIIGWLTVAQGHTRPKSAEENKSVLTGLCLQSYSDAIYPLH